MSWTPVIPKADPDAAIGSRTILMPLTHLAVVDACGADATAFLHAQLSNDVQGLAPGHSLLAGYCSAKGRLYALPRLWRRGDDWRLCLPADIADAVLKRLRMFVMRSKVLLTRRDDFTLFGVAGDDAAACLRLAGLLTPGAVDAVESTGDTSVLRWPGAPPRFQVCMPDADAPACWAALSAGAQPAPATAWRLLDIDAGQPAIYAPTLEAFVPQMVNLELIGGVNFKKGCYPGQEIVARMHYLGKPSRRMYRLSTTTGQAHAGATVLDDNKREVGTVVDAQPAAMGDYRVLAVLQVAAADEPLHLADGTRLDRLALPYALERAAEANH
jgi:folate-binding protein YgfZ